MSFSQSQPQSNWAPQSPDLSGFYSTESPPLPQHHQHFNHNQTYQPTFEGIKNEFDYSKNQYMPPIPDLPPTHSFQNAKLNPSAPQQSAYYPIPPQFKGEIAYENPNYIPSPPMSSRGPRIKNDPGTATASMSNAPRKDPNPNNIEIKTKFPVARIKRIMQADEEVGKVAQVTPVAVSKALELFMISLVSSSAEIAKEKGQKRVTAQHLKSVVLGNDQFDFLSEIVNKISEAQEGAGGETKKRKGEAKADTDSSEEEKKPKKGRGRKKKSDD